MRKTLFSLLNIAIVTGLTLLPTVSVYGQSLTDAEIIKAIQDAATAQNQANAPTQTTTPKTTTKTVAPIKTEALNFSTGAADRQIILNQVIDINLRSFSPAETPIEIYLLAFNANGTPVRKIFIKNVYNQTPNVFKRYRLMFNQEIISKAGNASYVQIGYCIGGCKVSRSKLVKGKLILPRIQPLSLDNSTI